MTENELLNSVLELAAVYDWMAHHCRPAQVRAGRWVTPIAGNSGFPDLVLAHPSGRVKFAELKADRGQVRPEQKVWASVLETHPGIEVHLWRPKDWTSGVIRQALEVAR